jgi:hypothetical protein
MHPGTVAHVMLLNERRPWLGNPRQESRQSSGGNEAVYPGSVLSEPMSSEAVMTRVAAELDADTS